MLRGSLVDQLYEIIKDRILNLELKLGQRINTQQIAGKFKISQTPVRDVLNRLAKDGLIKVVPRIGYYVVDPSSKDLREVYDLRKMFECYALRSGIENIDRKKLEKIKKRCEELRDKGDKKRKKAKFDETDRELHQLIINSSKNKRLQSLFSQIYGFVKISISLGVDLDRALPEHLDVINALLEKNLQKSIEALERHIDASAEEATQLFKRYSI